MDILQKCQFIGTVFTGGAKAQLKQEWTWAAAAVAGLYQGLKYKGSLKSGIAGGVAVLGTLAIASGVYNLVMNGEKIKDIFSKKEE